MFCVAEKDTHINPRGIKGIGMIGCVGTSVALCKAIFHPIGKRGRGWRVRIENCFRQRRAEASFPEPQKRYRYPANTDV